MVIVFIKIWIFGKVAAKTDVAKALCSISAWCYIHAVFVLSNVMMILSAIGITQNFILDFLRGDPYYILDVVLWDFDTMCILLNVCYTTSLIFMVMFFYH